MLRCRSTVFATFCLVLYSVCLFFQEDISAEKEQSHRYLLINFNTINEKCNQLFVVVTRYSLNDYK